MCKEMDVDQIDFNKKIFYMSWYFFEDSIVIVVINNVRFLVDDMFMFGFFVDLICSYLFFLFFDRWWGIMFGGVMGICWIDCYIVLDVYLVKGLQIKLFLGCGFLCGIYV